MAIICTTSPSFENREISAYCGIVAAEVSITGFSAGAPIEVLDGLTLDLALQSSRFEEARSKAFDLIKGQAQQLRADAIISVRFEYCAFGKNGLLNMVAAYGTAVRIQFSKEDREQHRLAEGREKAHFMVSIDGKQRGPFSIAQLSTLVAQGRLNTSAIVHVEDTGEAVAISQLLPRDIPDTKQS